MRRLAIEELLFDEEEGGGAGIMIDDVVAGIFACATLHLGLWLGN